MAKTFSKIITISLLGISILTIFSGCALKNNEKIEATKPEIIKLTYYRLFDGEDIFKPIIESYQNENPNIRINYKKFTDAGEYMDLIINEMAEGEGPDIFSLHNTEFTQHRRKLFTAPTEIITPTEFTSTFAPITVRDLLSKNEAGETSIYGLPLYVDTLALYYNQDHFEEAIPSQKKPGATWAEIQENVAKLNLPDLSFERFKRAGIAMGRADNILRATDLIYALFIQFNVNFYDAALSEATFAEGVNPPAEEVLNLFLSFGLPSSPYFSWNSYISETESAEKEILSFARGKVSMIFGYSYLYDQIIDTIKELNRKGSDAIQENAIQVAPLPQLLSPLDYPETQSSYPSYFAETVSRTSKYPKEAWAFLKFLGSKENIEYYHEKTHRPSSRLDLIQEQKEEPIYGIFANQIEYAKNLPVINSEKYDAILRTAIMDALATKTPIQALKDAQTQINALIPEGGLLK